jgi:hypothetical protein
MDWMKGDSISVEAVFGEKNVPGETNTPGYRYNSTAGRIRRGIFGFFGGNSNRNDLWRYKPAANQWTWISGDSTVDMPSIYGMMGIAAPANKPGAGKGLSHGRTLVETYGCLVVIRTYTTGILQAI